MSSPYKKGVKKSGMTVTCPSLFLTPLSTGLFFYCFCIHFSCKKSCNYYIPFLFICKSPNLFFSFCAGTDHSKQYKDTFPSAGIPVPGHWKSPSKNFSKKALTNFIFCVYTTTHKATALWNSIPGRLFLYHRTAGYPDPDSRGTHPAEHDPFPISPV